MRICSASFNALSRMEQEIEDDDDEGYADLFWE
jgi:hypothetical protein